MTVYEYRRSGWQRPIGERVIALGFFDGVHVGHRALLQRAALEAKKIDVPLAVFTFRAQATESKGGVCLYNTEQKLSLLEKCGVDEVILADFDDVRDVGAEDFALELLIMECGARIAVSGKDFRFGRGATGDVDMLSRLFAEHGRRAIAIEDVVRFKVKVSTTQIKAHLSIGNIILANAMLGSTFFLDGRVRHGNGAGRGLGYPTVNYDLEGREKLLMSGVYVTRVEVNGKKYQSVTNVGSCPTLGERAIHAETYIIGFSGDLYDATVRTYFYRFLREEQTFDSEARLREQIDLDVKRAIEINEEIY